MFKKFQMDIGDILDFPPEVTGEGPKITITGRRQILIENYLRIVNFSEEEIRLETAEGELCLKGRNLVLKVILATELYIEGELASLGFDGEGLE